MSNEVRIIGGRWRSRRIRFPSLDQLRPTPDRVRETVFNWLQGEIEDTRCLDLFAGSGALSFEAASRGAHRVVAVDRNARVCEALRRSCAALEATQVEVIHTDASRFLSGAARPFDIIFLDPPFRQNRVAPLCHTIERGPWLTDQGWLYIEAEAEWPITSLEPTWDIVRSQKSGDVGYHLCRPPS